MTHSGLRWATLALALAWLSSAGCSVLAPRPDSTRFFTLTPIDGSQAPPAEGVSGSKQPLTYGLGPITLPPYLDRNGMAVRVSPTEIRYSAVDHWAEPLRVSVPRVLMANISTLLKNDHIVNYPWEASSAVDYRIEVEVLRFESTAAGNHHVGARWGIKDGRSGKELVTRTSNIERAGGTADPAASAAALSAALADLSNEIVAAARQLPPSAAVARK